MLDGTGDLVRVPEQGRLDDIPGESQRIAVRPMDPARLQDVAKPYFRYVVVLLVTLRALREPLAAWRGLPGAGAYSASKAALGTLLESYRRDADLTELRDLVHQVLAEQPDSENDPPARP